MTFMKFAPAVLAAMLIGGSAFISVSAQEVDLKKYPDYRPYDPALERTMPQRTTNTAAGSNTSATRPDHVNNALSIFYPPVFCQSGGSCGSAQAIGYIFAHDMNNMPTPMPRCRKTAMPHILYGCLPIFPARWRWE